MMPRVRRAARALAAFVPLAALAALVGACSSVPSTSDRVTLEGPLPGDFSASVGGVEPVFERRCGSFDCHGNPSRPLRIYGQFGLRQPNDAGILPGTAPTTTAEISANYQSIIAVEPELMTQVVTQKGDPYSLLILKKPLMLVSHKGGPALTKDSDPEKCISSWISGKTDKAACTNAGQLP